MDDQPKPLQVSDLMAERQSIKSYVRTKMPLVEDISRLAVAYLEQDIADPALEAVSQTDPDIFVARANQFGVELFGIKAYSYAMVVFGDLLSKAEDFVKATGKSRALGALKVNLGISLIKCRNFDAGVSILLEAATVDEMNRYQTAPETSNALRLLNSYVLEEMASNIALLCTDKFKVATGFPLGPESIMTLANHHDPLGAATLVSLIPLMQHPHWQKRASSLYGRVRFLDGLRWLSAMFENMAKKMCENSLDTTTATRFSANSQFTLWPTLQILFDKEAWWLTVITKQKTGQATILQTDSDNDVVTKFKALLALPETNRDALLVKCVLLAYMTRNLSAHYLDLASTVIDQVGDQIVAYQLLAQVLVFDWVYRKGHFVTLAAPGVWPP